MDNRERFMGFDDNGFPIYRILDPYGVFLYNVRIVLDKDDRVISRERF